METLVLCGVGGYGQTYVKALLENTGNIRWVGAVEPFPDGIGNKSEIDAAGVPWFGSLEDFYRNSSADICVVASPIAFHAAQSILALQNGSHVLCEKPVAALPSQALEMISARDNAGRFLGIGYQWSYSNAVLKLKKDISDNLFGRPLRMRTRVLSPRNRAYYDRGSGWAGRMKDAAGRWVLDSVANNATAHYLHNMLYILGESNRAAMPDSLNTVLMRANPIHMYDTAFIRMVYGGAIISFVATHAGEEAGGVISRFEFERGTIVYDGSFGGSGCFTGMLQDGTAIDYGNPYEAPSYPLREFIASLRGEGDIGFSCPIEASIPHNSVMIAALMSSEIGIFPDVVNDGNRFYVPGLDEICKICDENLSLPETGWAKQGVTVNLDDPRIMSYGCK